jgi:hypothetical protein
MEIKLLEQIVIIFVWWFFVWAHRALNGPKRRFPALVPPPVWPTAYYYKRILVPISPY